MPNHRIRDRLNRISDDLLSLEIGMIGSHFTAGTAEEVRALAERLNNLCRPDKGHLKDGAEARGFKDAA